MWVTLDGQPGALGIVVGVCMLETLVVVGGDGGNGVSGSPNIINVNAQKRIFKIFTFHCRNNATANLLPEFGREQYGRVVDCHARVLGQEVTHFLALLMTQLVLNEFGDLGSFACRALCLFLSNFFLLLCLAWVHVAP